MQLGQAVARGVPLVGREGHVARIVAVVRAAAGGAGGVLLVTGDGGMGKSRLLEESTARLDPGTLVAWGRCSNRDDAPAYWPWVQVLRCLGGELTAAELTASSLAAGVVARAVPELGDLFGVAAVADEPSHGLLREAVIESCPPQERRTLEAAAGVLAERHGDDPAWSASIGHHLVAGLSLTDPVDAVARLRVAADHAASRLAHDEAARHLASAAGLLRVEARCDVQLWRCCWRSDRRWRARPARRRRGATGHRSCSCRRRHCRRPRPSSSHGCHRHRWSHWAGPPWWTRTCWLRSTPSSVRLRPAWRAATATPPPPRSPGPSTVRRRSTWRRD